MQEKLSNVYVTRPFAVRMTVTHELYRGLIVLIYERGRLRVSLAFQEVPSPQHLVRGVTECDQLFLRARLRHHSLGSALSVDRSLSQGDHAACVTFHVGMYGKGCIDVCNNMDRFKHFKSYTYVLGTPRTYCTVRLNLS